MRSIDPTNVFYDHYYWTSGSSIGGLLWWCRQLSEAWSRAPYLRTSVSKHWRAVRRLQAERHERDTSCTSRSKQKASHAGHVLLACRATQEPWEETLSIGLNAILWCRLAVSLLRLVDRIMEHSVVLCNVLLRPRLLLFRLHCSCNNKHSSCMRNGVNVGSY
jgi:hypothetical protein